LLLTIIFAISIHAFGQQSEPGKLSDSKASPEVEQAILNFYKALYSDDKETVVSFLLDEGFFYQPGYPLETGKSAKTRLKYNMDQGRINAPYSYEVADFTILMIDNDAAVAHYRVEARSLKDPKDEERYLVTDTLVRRNGRWQILAEDTSPTPRPPGTDHRGFTNRLGAKHSGLSQQLLNHTRHLNETRKQCQRFNKVWLRQRSGLVGLSGPGDCGGRLSRKTHPVNRLVADGRCDRVRIIHAS
jgi:hypothetical protein